MLTTVEDVYVNGSLLGCYGYYHPVCKGYGEHPDEEDSFELVGYNDVGTDCYFHVEDIAESFIYEIEEACLVKLYENRQQSIDEAREEVYISSMELDSDYDRC